MAGGVIIIRRTQERKVAKKKDLSGFAWQVSCKLENSIII